MKLKFFPLALTIIILSLSACNNKHDNKPIFADYTTILTLDKASDELKAEFKGYPYIFIADEDSCILYPNNHASNPQYKPANNTRAVIQYHIDKDDQATKSYITEKIELLAANGILTKDIVHTNKPDTLGTNEIEIASPMWISGGTLDSKKYLNINFRVYTPNMPTTHIINLAEIEGKSEIDSEGYYHLSLNHKYQNSVSSTGYTSVSMASFALEDKHLAPEVLGLKITAKEISGNITTVTFKYNDK